MKEPEENKVKDEVKKECPWKFKGLSQYRHLCPHIQDKQETTTTTTTTEIESTTNQPSSSSSSSSFPSGLSKAQNKVPTTTTEQMKTLPTEGGINSSLPPPSSWLAWLVSWTNPTPPSTTCEPSLPPGKSNDDDAEKKPTSPPSRENMTAKELSQVLGTSYLINANGDRVKVETLVGKTLGLYFSASWCPPCRRFLDIILISFFLY